MRSCCDRRPRAALRRAAAALLLLGAPRLAAAAGAPPEVLDRVVAVIEDEIITQRELDAKVAPYLGQLAEIDDAEARARRHDQMRRQVLDIEIGERMVAREIQQNRERLGVGDKDVDRAVEEVLHMNSLTREQLQAALYGQGLTWSEYRAKLREQIERARLIQLKVQGQVQIKDADARRRCLERQRTGARDLEVCASHVLFEVPADADEAAQQQVHARASRLQAELAAGADFAAYALKYSADRAAPDGKLGCFHRGEMVEAFDQVAFELEVGEVSPVLRTDFGFHIIKVTDRRAASTSACEAEADLAPFRNELYQDAIQQQMGVWVETLRKKAFVEVRL